MTNHLESKEAFRKRFKKSVENKAIIDNAKQHENFYKENFFSSKNISEENYEQIYVQNTIRQSSSFVEMVKKFYEQSQNLQN